MRDAKLVHVGQADKDLSYVLFDLGHGQKLFLTVEVLEDILKRHVAELENGILDDPLLVIKRIEKVEELDHVVLAS